jgi:uncharacterized protein (DUF433 family)
METLLPITSHPEVLGGQAVFAGTRVPVETLFDYILDGETLDTFLENFHTVKREDAVKVLEHFRSSAQVGAHG